MTPQLFSFKKSTQTRHLMFTGSVIANNGIHLKDDQFLFATLMGSE